MNDLLMLLAENAVLLAAGTTLLLSLGCGVAMLCKSPVHRQRIAELTIAGVLGWMVLALLPLPRLLPLAVSRDSSARDAARMPEVPAIAPLLAMEVTEEEREIASPDEFQELAGLGSPSYIPSPSEELPPVATQSPTAPAQEPEPAVTPSTWQFDRTQLAGLFTGAYLAGAVLCVLWILAGHVVLLRIRMTAEAPAEWLAEQYQSLAKKSGIAPPQLIVSRLCSRPLTWGVLWPVVVLPRSLCRQENKSQLDTILLHELGHIAQQDAQGNLLFCIALPLLYAHPLYWWLRRESQLAAELVADDWAAWQTGKETYVEELVALARCTGTSSLPLVGVTGLFSSPSQFYRRMHMLLAREKPLSTKTSLPWRLASLSALAGAVALAASLAGVRPAAGQTEPPTVPPLPVLTPAIGAPETPPPVTEPLPAIEPIPPIAPPVAVPPPAGVNNRFVPATRAIPATPPTPALDPVEAALIAEIRALHDKLKALEEKRRPTKPGAPPTAGIRSVNLLPGLKSIQITRVDDQGGIWEEVWTTDEKGQPAKIISVSGYNLKLPAPFVSPLPDGTIITKEYVEKDGSRRTVMLDAATGKVIAENHAGGIRYLPTEESTDVVPPDTIAGKPVPLDEPRTDYPIPVVGKGSRTVVTTPPVQDAYAPLGAARPAGVPSAAPADRQLDLVSLATSYADAVSVLEAAEARSAEIVRLGGSKAISQQEVTSAELALRAAKRKERLLQSIAEVATECAAQDFERSSRLYKQGEITGAAAAEAKTRLAILKEILDTRPAAKDPVPSKP